MTEDTQNFITVTGRPSGATCATQITCHMDEVNVLEAVGTIAAMVGLLRFEVARIARAVGLSPSDAVTLLRMADDLLQEAFDEKCRKAAEANRHV